MLFSVVGIDQRENQVADTVMNSKAGPGAKRVFEAVYEDGVLKPLHDPGLTEHQRFSVQVQELDDTPAAEEIAAWQEVYQGLSDEDLAVVEQLALDRSRFSRRQPG